MSIVNADAKSLEWISYLFISQDKVGIEEWLAFCDNPKLNDIHTKNQKDLNLVSRLIAKIFQLIGLDMNLIPVMLLNPL